jgi:Predicted membrane protein
MEIIWKEKKKWALFGLPWTFTTYSLTEDKLLIDSGILTTRQDEIMLYRILDVTLTKNLIQRINNLGTITVISSDQSCPTLKIKNIYDSTEIKEKLSELVDKARDKKRVFSREIIDNHADTNDIQEWL